MNRWKMGAALLLAAALGACGGGNSTKAGITITAASTAAGANTVTVPVSGTEQFGATVTGITSTAVEWQVCLPAPVITVKPTNCTTIPGVTPAKGTTILTGFGTINQLGFYTAPATIPTPSTFVILATSPADATAFGLFNVVIDSGIRVQLSPTDATIEAGENVQFTVTVTGTANSSVTWEVAGTAGGDATDGFICPSPSAPQPCTPGQYFAPLNKTGSETITALSGADGSTKATATVTILAASAGTDPTIVSIEPETAAQGSVQQQIYITGANFTSNGSVVVGGVTSIPSCDFGSSPSCYLFLSSSLLRVPVPASSLANAGPLSIAFQLQVAPAPAPPATVSGSLSLQVIPSRPSIVASSPKSVSSTSAAATVNLTGGFFSPGATSVVFDGGNEGAVGTSLSSSRQLSATLLAGALSTPGLYSITVQNSGVIPGQPSLAGVNIAVTPSSIPAALGPGSPISLGGASQPSAIAVDFADGVAAVAETGANSVALINLATNTVSSSISVGKQPTGIAVDDLLPHRLALVVNSGDNTVSVIDLTAAPPAVTKTISLTNFTPTTSKPVAIAINSQTHRAIVANASTNLATVIDLVTPNAAISCTTAPCVVQTVGGSLTNYSTGANPAIGIDSQLNWAVVTPGGAGSVNLVDLGFGSSSPGSGGRAPAVVGTLSISSSIQGVSVNSETHDALFTDFNTGNLTNFSLLDNTVTPIFANGIPLSLPEENAAAANPLQNIGIAINAEGSGTASIVDMGNQVVLQTVTGLTTSGGAPQAVAIDPATNEALVANQTAGTISIVSLGAAPGKPLQILETSPSMTFTSASTLPLTINGMGFVAGSSILIDGTAIPAGNVTFVSSRQLTATVPASFTGSARRLAVQVQNPAVGAGPITVSNISPVSLVQAITVGTSPAGVAIDTDRDVAVVTNSGDGTVSIVSLAPAAISPQSLGPVGLVGPALNVHANPRAVAVDSRLGLAVVANYDSNDISLVDFSEVFGLPYSRPPVAGCAVTSVCTGPAGLAFNPDNDGFLVTDSNIGTASSDINLGSVTAPTITAAATISIFPTPEPVDQTPGDTAVAPTFNPADLSLTYAAIATAAQTSVIDFVNTASELVVGRTNGLSQPTGVIYDSLNNVFLVSDSLNNDIVVVSPLTFVPSFFRGGFNPTSIAYNQQTSTIVAVNGATGTLSVLDYLCPPSTSAPACTSPHVRAILGLVGSQVSSTAPLGPKTVGIDPRLNLAVLVDAVNNRVLLIPLPY